MRKFQDVAASSLPAPRRSRAGMVLIFFLVMIVAPFAYEGGSMIVARWQSMYGTHREPKTPVLDAVSVYSREIKHEVSRRTNRTLLAGNWNPSLAIPLAISWAALGAFFLRRGH